MNPSDARDAEADARRRKLKRVAKGSGESRYAKLSEDRRKQKTGSIEHKSADDFVGLILGGGRYEVLGKLGKGSMAYVFRARDERLETDVVIKIPKPEKLEGEEIRERFQKESQLLVRLAHPNVVNVLDVGEHERVPYVVMQLLSGGTLLDKMDDVQGKLRRMKPSFLKTWLREVARALDYCAKQGTVHRDVKPANILFDDDGNGYIADFGLTKIMFGEHTALNSSDTTAGIVLGTPNYIAPEIVLGKPYDGRADQYSLGISVYHALIGRPPMQGASATVTMINQTQKRLQLLSDVCSDVPKDMALAIRKCIDKDADKRFDSCEEFAESVIDGLRGSSASSMSLSGMVTPPAPVVTDPLKPAVKKRKRKPAAPAAKRRKSSGSSSGSAKAPVPVEALPPDPYANDPLLDSLAGGDGTDWLADPAMPAPTRSKKKTGKKGKGKGRKRSANTISIGSMEFPRIPFLAGVSVTAALLVVGAASLFSSGPDTPEQSVASTSAQNPGTGTPAANRPKANGQGGASKEANPKKTAVAANRKQGGNKKNQGGGRKNKNGDAAQPANAPGKPANKGNQAPTKVAEAPKIQQISASKTVDPANERKSANSIPWKAGEKLTVGGVKCPTLVVGNNVWSKETNTFTATLSGRYSPDAATALSPNGTLFAASEKIHHASNNSVTVWDVTSGDQLVTIPGSAERSVDAILLGEDIAYVASRSSNILLRWHCREKRQLPPTKMPGASFSDRNTTISNDGQFIATVIDGRMTVWSTANGERVAAMTNPSAKPIEKRSSLAGTGIPPEWKPAQDASDIFSEIQHVAFSPDNQFLSAFSNHSGGRMICWNGTGEIVADHATFVRHKQTRFQPAIDWFDVDRSWLTAGRVTLRRQGRVVMVTSPAEATPHLGVYDGNHFVGVFDFSSDRMSVVHLPIEKINGSLKSLREDGNAAILSREKPVSMQLNLTPYFAPASPEIAEFRKAFRTAVNRDGLKVDKDSPMVFSLKVAVGEASLPIYERFNNPGRRTQSLAVSPDESYLVMQLKLPGQPEPIWRRRLVSTDELESNPDIEALTELVESQVVPFFIPTDDDKLALPVMIH